MKEWKHNYIGLGERKHNYIGLDIFKFLGYKLCDIKLIFDEIKVKSIQEPVMLPKFPKIMCCFMTLLSFMGHFWACRFRFLLLKISLRRKPHMESITKYPEDIKKILSLEPCLGFIYEHKMMHKPSFEEIKWNLTCHLKFKLMHQSMWCLKLVCDDWKHS